jgi:hypothetical protein
MLKSRSLIKIAAPAALLISLLVWPMPPGQSQSSLELILKQQQPQTFTLAQRSIKKKKPIKKKRSRLTWRVYVRPASYRVGGMARSSTCESGGALTAMMPSDKMAAITEENQLPIDYTISGYPSFWAYVPETQAPTEAKFTLQVVDGKERKQIYSKQFRVDGRSGLVGIRLPKSIEPLQVGQRYLWQMRLACGDSQKPDKHPVIGSWIERVDPMKLETTPTFNPKELMKDLNEADPNEQPKIYSELGFWHDAIGTLGELKQQKPADSQIAEDWKDLLSQNEMENLTSLPILGIF